MSHHNDENHSKASAGEGDLGYRRESHPAEGGSHAGRQEGRHGETLARLLFLVESGSDQQAGG